MVFIEQKAKTITESCGEQKSALVNDSHVDVRMQMCDSVQDRRGCLACCLGLMIERIRGKYLVYHLLRLRTCLTWNHCTPWGNALTSYQIEGVYVGRYWATQGRDGLATNTVSSWTATAGGASGDEQASRFGS